jgi:hypothetical protein
LPRHACGKVKTQRGCRAAQDNEEGCNMGNQQRESNPNRQQGQPAQSGADTKQQGQQNVYGEGNYEATRDYNARTKRFLESGQVDEAARAAEPGSEAEALDMAAAEAEGKRHAKEEDPALSRKSDKGERGAEDTSTPKPGQDQE